MSFRERYNSDPEFREKHKQYIMTKVECECGCMVRRNYMSTHKKTKKHIELLNKKTDNIAELKKEIARLKKLSKKN
jgi:hypothetical protein